MAKYLVTVWSAFGQKSSLIEASSTTEAEALAMDAISDEDVPWVNDCIAELADMKLLADFQNMEDQLRRAEEQEALPWDDVDYEREEQERLNPDHFAHVQEWIRENEIPF